MKDFIIYEIVCAQTNFMLLILAFKPKTYPTHIFQGSDYLFEMLLRKFILLQPYVGWVKMKTCRSTNFLSPYYSIFPAFTENIFNVWNYRFSGLTSIYLFKFSDINSRIKCEVCSKVTIETPKVVLVSLLLTDKLF